MPLAPCARCKKLFNKRDLAVCPVCEPAENEDIEKVRAVIDDNPDLAAQDVADKAEVDIAIVNRMLDRGVIAMVSGTEDVKCGRCGAPAISMAKKLCQPCLDKLNAEMMQAQSKIRLDEKKVPEIGKYNVRESFEEKRR